MNIEDVYRISLARYRSDVNSYEFQYQYQWSTSNHIKRFMSIREVRLISSPRNLFIEGLKLKDSATNKTCDVSCNIIVPSGTTLTQTDFRTCINDLYTSQVLITDSPWKYLAQFYIGYDPCTSTLSFTTTSDRQLIFGDTLGTDYDVSDDLKAITGIYDPELWNDLSLLTYGDETMIEMNPVTELTHFDEKWFKHPIRIAYDSAVNRRVVGIHFTNVWNRDPLLLKASFVDLAYDGYLGFTNSVFTPPKRYDIKSNTNRFTIQLFDGVSARPIILPNDHKDQVIIEAIMSTAP